MKTSRHAISIAKHAEKGSNPGIIFLIDVDAGVPSASSVPAGDGGAVCEGVAVVGLVADGVAPLGNEGKGGVRVEVGVTVGLWLELELGEGDKLGVGVGVSVGVGVGVGVGVPASGSILKVPSLIETGISL